MRRYTIEAGTTPGEKEKGAWLKLTDEEMRTIRGLLPVARGGIYHIIDHRLAQAQRGLR